MTSHPRRLAIVALVAAALVPACADDHSDDTDGGQGTDGGTDGQIELTASQWGRGATTFCIIGIAVLLGFSDTDRLREYSYPFIAQMLMFALLWGLWFDQLVAALLYWRDRRAMS